MTHIYKTFLRVRQNHESYPELYLSVNCRKHIVLNYWSLEVFQLNVLWGPPIAVQNNKISETKYCNDLLPKFFQKDNWQVTLLLERWFPL